MKAGQSLPEVRRDSLSPKRKECSKALTLEVLIILTLLNLWIAAKPSQFQQLIFSPNRYVHSRSTPAQLDITRMAKISPLEQAGMLLQNLQFPNNTWRAFPSEVRHDPLLGYDFGLAHKAGWVKNKTRVWECVNKLGPHRQITFLGDSVTRNFYKSLVADLGGPSYNWVGITNGSEWWLAQADFELDSDIAQPFGAPPLPNVTLSFRFACNSFPHMTKILSDPKIRNSDVVVLNSGLWELGTGTGDGTLNGSWMRDYMYRLSQLVLHLKQNFKGRVIWRNIGAMDWYKQKEMKRFLPFKLRAMNLFAERLFRGAGYEVLDFWSAMAIDPTGLTTHDGLHGGQQLLADLVFNKVCLEEPALGVDTAAEIVRAIEASSMPPPFLQGPDPPFLPFPE